MIAERGADLIRGAVREATAVDASSVTRSAS